MALSRDGLDKLVEEIGEVILAAGQVLQTTGKLNAYPDGDHPDGKGNLHERLAAELGQLKAAIEFVIDKHNLDYEIVRQNMQEKEALYDKWHTEP